MALPGGFGLTDQKVRIALLDIVRRLTALEAAPGAAVQSAAPTAPAVGDLWLDTDTNVLAVWDGAAWQ